MPIKSIYHLSDIHIRAGNSERSREHEYLSVFDNLFKTLESINPEESVIVLTGDLFHNKHRLEPHGMRLAIKLFKGLSALARTYVIRGNHDYRQDAPEELDMIGAFNEYDIPNLFYMDDTGTFEVDNVGFGLVAIQDALLRNSTSGIAAELPEFPVPEFSDAVTHTVALFHGSVIQAKLQNGQAVERDGYPLEWFKGYDLILLGDIHLQQVHRASRIEATATATAVSTQLSTYSLKKGTWAYPGSLLQQDFGEALLGHGLLHWDLSTNQVTEHHIHNPYGYVTVRLTEELVEVCIRKDGKSVFVPGASILSCPWFPSKLYVRVVNGGSATVLQTAVRLLQGFGKEVLSISELNHLATPGASNPVITVEADMDMMELNSPMMWEQFITDNCSDIAVQGTDLWRSWLQRPDEILIPVEGLDTTLSSLAKDRNDKLIKHVDSFNDAVEAHLRESGLFGKVSLKYLSWNWLFNYGADNHYNFGDCDGKLVILNAKNGCGKSNFFEVLCVALFGSGFPSRFNKNFSAAILNDKTPVSGIPSSLLIFELNGKEYCIERVFHARTQKGQENLIKYTKIAITEVPSGTVVCQNKVAVDNWLETHIGSLETFLSSCMLTQDGDCNFFSLEKAAQKRLIDDVFSLKAVQNLQLLLEEGKKAYRGILKDMDLWLAAKGNQSDDTQSKELGLQLTQVVERLSAVKAELVKAHEGWSAYASRTFRDRSEAVYRAELDSLEPVEGSGDLVTLSEERRTLKNRIAELSSTLQTKTAKKAEKTEKAMKPKVSYKDTVSRLERYQQEERDLKRSWINRTEDEETESESESFAEIGIISKQAYEAIVAEKRGWLEGWRRRGVTVSTTVQNTTSSSLQQINEDLSAAEEQQLQKMDKNPGLPAKQWLTLSLHEIQERLDAIGSVDESKIPILESIARTYPSHTDRWARLNTEIKDLKQQLKDYETMPFNPDCSACKAQPWIKRQEETRSRLAKAQDDRKQVQTILANLADTYGDAEDVTSALQDFRSKVQLKAELTRALLYRTWAIEADTIRDTIKRLRLTKEQTILYELVQQFKQEQAIWDEKESVGCRGWSKGVKAGLAQATLDMEAWTAWTVAEALSETTAAEKRCAILDKEIGTIETSRRRAEISGIIAAFPCWQQETELRQEELALTTKESEVRQKLAAVAVQDGVAAVSAAKKKIEVRYRLIEVLAEAFKSYRQWLYKDKLRPLIQGAVNGLLVNICDGRPLFLEAEWLDAIDTFAWFLRDGTSRPIIEKASGFQRFIVGMAMRIAMSRLGICKVVYEQLFIDEGFTACDGPNLEKTPAFLRALLGSYKSVLLATHLEELKACGDYQILIRRSDLSGIASIQAGLSRHLMPDAPVKRVKKTTAIATSMKGLG